MGLKEKLMTISKESGLDSIVIEDAYRCWIRESGYSKIPAVRIFLTGSSDDIDTRPLLAYMDRRCSLWCKRSTFMDIGVMPAGARDPDCGEMPYLYGVYHGMRDLTRDVSPICIGGEALDDVIQALEDDDNLLLSVSIVMSQLGGASGCVAIARQRMAAGGMYHPYDRMKRGWR